MEDCIPSRNTWRVAHVKRPVGPEKYATVASGPSAHDDSVMTAVEEGLGLHFSTIKLTPIHQLSLRASTMSRIILHCRMLC